MSVVVNGRVGGRVHVVRHRPILACLSFAC